MTSEPNIDKLVADYRKAWEVLDMESVHAIWLLIPAEARERAARRTDADQPYPGWPDKKQPLGSIDEWTWAPQAPPRKRGKVGRRPKRKRQVYPVEVRMATDEELAYWATIPRRPGATEPPDDEGDRIRIAQLCGKSGLRHTAVDRGPISG